MPERLIKLTVTCRSTVEPQFLSLLVHVPYQLASVLPPAAHVQSFYRHTVFCETFKVFCAIFLMSINYKLQAAEPGPTRFSLISLLGL